MATYVNNLRLKEIATGAESGTWGTSTNTNLELIADALGSGTEAITTNADTHTTTIADGAADEGRALFLKYTGTLDSACTITLAPDTINKVWFIENATSGSQNIIISQGSGANITIGNGKIAVILTDGAGSGAAVLDAFADLELSSTLTVAGAASLASTLAVTGAITGSSTIQGTTITATTAFVPDASDGAALGTTALEFSDLYLADGAVIGLGDDQDVTLTHVADTGLLLNSTRQLQFNDSSQYISGTSATVLSIAATDEIDLTATAVDLNGTLNVSGTSTLTGAVTFTGATTQSNGSTDADILNTIVNSATNLFYGVSDSSANRFTGSSNNYAFWGTSSAHGLEFATNNNVRFTIDSAGDATIVAGYLSIAATEKLYLDGGANTFITEASGDRIEVHTGGAERLRITTTEVQCNENFIVGATDKIYLDGGSNTYIVESSGDVIKLFTGGTAGITLGASQDVTIAGDLVVSGTGPHAIGATVQNAMMYVGGTFTSTGASSTAHGWWFNNVTAGASGDTTLQTALYCQGKVTTQAVSETITDVVGVFIADPNITKGSGSTITNASSLKIEAAPSEGTNNYALWVDAGATRLDGDLDMSSGGDFYLKNGEKLYLDSGGDTYLWHSSSNNVVLHVGGQDCYTQTATATTFAKATTLSSTLAVTGLLTGTGGITLSNGSTDADILNTIVNSATELMFGVSDSSANRFVGSSNNYAFWGTSSAHGLEFATNNNVRMTIASGGTVNVVGTFTAGTKTFKIDHPLPDKADSHHLIHSCIEGPRADLIYRGTVDLSGGSAQVDLDEAAGMSAGTWELLCRDPQVWLQNDSGWSKVRGSVEGNTLTIESKDTVSDDTVSWMVVAERCDPHIMETELTDDDGRVIVEPEKEDL
jgi:fibronectin-binding autotransporter adhesin